MADLVLSGILEGRGFSQSHESSGFFRRSSLVEEDVEDCSELIRRKRSEPLEFGAPAIGNFRFRGRDVLSDGIEVLEMPGKVR